MHTMTDYMEKVNYIKKILSSNNVNLMYKEIKPLFGYNNLGKPTETNGQVLYLSWKYLEEFSNDLAEELMFKRFHQHSEDRYEEYIKPNMIELFPDDFIIGNSNSLDIYYGGGYSHKAKLSPFYVGKTVVTNKIYGQYDYSYLDSETNLPAVNVTWYDAVMFGFWVGCRLLTEAEWEYSCRGNSKTDWCCEKESELEQYAWYSHNSDGLVHPVAQLKHNNLGLYDFHGNVWEWCFDGYEEDYYARAPYINPINKKEGVNKVCRGGSMHAFSEMCTCTFRHNEPAYFYSSDLGFRLAKNRK